MNFETHDFSERCDRLMVPFEPESVERKEGDDGEPVGMFRGMASTFGNVDLVGDIIEPGAFKGVNGKPAKVKMLWQHDMRQPIGVWTRMEESERGLEVEGELVLEVRQAAEAFALMKRKAIDGLSIGFRVPAKGDEFDRERGVRILKKIDLIEVSVVTLPANPKARVQRVKSPFADGNTPTERQVERLLRDVGFSQSDAKAFLAKGYAGLTQRDVGEVGELLAGLRKLSAVMTNHQPKG